jgi:serine/threonine-protein kinase SRPK3
MSKDASTKWIFAPSNARSIAAQVTLGLSYIHACGIVHGGTYLLALMNVFQNLIISLVDLHGNNILFEHPNFDALTVDELYEKVGKPYTVKTQRLDGKPLGPEVPSYLVLPAHMTIPAD